MDTRRSEKAPVRWTGVRDIGHVSHRDSAEEETWVDFSLSLFFFPF